MTVPEHSQRVRDLWQRAMDSWGDRPIPFDSSFPDELPDEMILKICGDPSKDEIPRGILHGKDLIRRD